MEKDIVLDGTRVRLEPVAAGHLNALTECANDPALWEFTFQGNWFATPQGAQRWLDDALAAQDMRVFAIVDRESGAVTGSTRYLDISEQHRKLEIGWTFLARRFWRTHVNTEAKLLMLEYAFERWGAVRVQLKAEAINQRSHRAILRLGATHEGTLRNFRIRPDTGEVRDTAFYSIIAAEWPGVKERLRSLTCGPRPTSQV